MGTLARLLKEDLAHVPDDAKLVEISYDEQTGKYTFLFENEQESPDAS